MQLLKLKWVSVYNIVLDMNLINLTKWTLLNGSNYSARVNLSILLMIMTLVPTTGFAESAAELRSPAGIDRAIKTSDSTLWGLSGVELALGGSIVTTAAAGGYGLYQLARGGESVATIVATLLALEVASVVILTGFAIKFGVAGLYLWPTEDDDNGDPLFEPTRNHDRLPSKSSLHQVLAVN
ncbi:MAG: hypothetical protein HOK99_08040 [Betaproteobacteria bacterium]|nr:hypothetical protein [Betaproteobacteria bacterium]